MSDYSDIRFNSEDILDRTQDEWMVLRLTDESSIVQLNHDGFTANDSKFKPSPTSLEWRKNFQHLRMNKSDRINRDSILRIIKHIVSGWTYDYWNHDYSSKDSPWISTTTDFNWAIWEIARRLTRLDRNQVKLTLIRRNKKYSGSYRGTKSIQIDPVDYLVKCTAEQVKTAMDFAKSASEVLYYGKIFDKDVLESTIWTRYSTPFDLPEYCSIPKKYWTNGESWLDRLVWNPRVDSFYDADEKMSDRDEQISSSRQPSRS